jgi:hypothetical protein
MDTDNQPVPNEEMVIKRQWIAVVAGFILFFIGGPVSERMFGVTRYGILGVCLPMLYLGISSILNRVSIIRLRGNKAYSRGKRAVVLGVIFIVFAVLYVILAFGPFLA